MLSNIQKLEGTANGYANGIHENGEVSGDANGVANGVNGVPNGDHGANCTFPGPSKIFVFSAYDENGVKREVESYRDYISSATPTSKSTFLDNLAYTLSHKRTHFSWKGFVIASSKEELVEKLSDATKSAVHSRKREVPNVGFVFTGQGAQWKGMGRELLVYPIFRKSVEDASDYVRSLGADYSLIGKAPS